MSPLQYIALGAVVGCLVWVSAEALAALFFGIVGPVLRLVGQVYREITRDDHDDPGFFGEL